MGQESVTFGSIEIGSASLAASRSRIFGIQAASAVRFLFPPVAAFQSPSANLYADANGMNLLDSKTVNIGIVKAKVREPDDGDVVDVDAMVVGGREPVLLEDSDVGTTNVIFIVDRSGSLTGAWIDMTKEALVKLIPDGTGSNLRFVALIVSDHDVTGSKS